AMGEMAKDGVLLRRYELGSISGDSSETKKSYEENGVATERRIKENLAKYEQTVRSAEGHRLLDNIKTHLDQYLAHRDHGLEVARNGKLKEALQICYHENKASFEVLDSDIAENVKFNRAQAVAAAKEAEKDYYASRDLVFGVLGVAIVVGIFLAMFVSRMIANPLRTMQEVAAKLALGDVEQNITNDSKDEIGSLAQSFREVIKYNQGVAHSCEILGRGDLTIDVQAKSEKDLLSKSFGTAIHSMRETIMEMADSSSGIASAAESFPQPQPR
ncbi:MAG TPA: methyl-accepting chemotaxis protein, partial [Candidatus Angelobacter sp.]|nr:methyl-accepting chemotaxis protein [Candidatus Angelobacter sp.]